MLLAGIGLYGLPAYAVVRRTQEIGIRVALGAQTRNVLWLIIGEGMSLAALGVLLGLGGAFGLTRMMQWKQSQRKSNQNRGRSQAQNELIL